METIGELFRITKGVDSYPQIANRANEWIRKQNDNGRNTGIKKMSSEQVRRIFTDQIERPEMIYLEALAEVQKVPYIRVLEAAGYAVPQYDQNTIKIPILGVIRAGLPLLACENIESYEMVTAKEAADGDYFYLRVQGDSMTKAKIFDGSIVFVRAQQDVDSGDIGIVIVDGENATVKKIIKNEDSITLKPESYNDEHKPLTIKNDYKIVGKVLHVKTFL